MITSASAPATAVVRAYLAGLPGAEQTVRTVGPNHWGLTLDAAGWPLHLGLAVRHGVLRAQAEVLPAGVADPHDLLYRNRRLRLARYTHAADGTVWIEADLPEEAVTAATVVDRLLGAAVAAAETLRRAAAG